MLYLLVLGCRGGGLHVICAIAVHLKDRNMYHCVCHQRYCKEKLLALVVIVWGRDITRERCLGAHIPRGNTYHCNTRLHRIQSIGGHTLSLYIPGFYRIQGIDHIEMADGLNIK